MRQRPRVDPPEDMHPQVAAVLDQASRLQDLMEGQLKKMADDSFSATDESGTVRVTLNGHHHLVDIHFADGLLRLGSETVAQRLNQALHKVTEEAGESSATDRERLNEAITDITG